MGFGCREFVCGTGGREDEGRCDGVDAGEGGEVSGVGDGEGVIACSQRKLSCFMELYVLCRKHTCTVSYHASVEFVI